MKRLGLVFLALALPFGCSPKKRQLHVFCWDDYFGKDTLNTFAAENDCVVTYDKYGSNEDMISKLRAGGEGYDVIFPSDEAVPVLIKEGLVQKLDSAKIPNRKNVSAKYLNLSFDPGNEYTLPYFWGTTGIAYNKDKVNPAPTSWKDLWNEKYKNRMSMLDDGHEALGAALRIEGKSINETDPAALGRARDRLVTQKPLLLKYSSEPKKELAEGTIWMAQCFNGDAIQARAAEGASPIEFVVPSEGGTLWLDNMAIPKGSKNVDLAHKFIDYVLRAEVAAEIANHVGYATPNDAARAHIDKAMLEDPVVYPSEDVLKRCEVVKPLADADKKRFADLWAEVKSK